MGDRPPPENGGARAANGYDRLVAAQGTGVPGAEPAHHPVGCTTTRRRARASSPGSAGRGDDLLIHHRTTRQGWEAYATQFASRSTCGQEDRARRRSMHLLIEQRQHSPRSRPTSFPTATTSGGSSTDQAPLLSAPPSPDRARDGFVDGRRGLCRDERRPAGCARSRTIFLGGAPLEPATAGAAAPSLGPLRRSHPVGGVADHRGARRRALALGHSIVANLNRRAPDHPLGAPATGAAAGSRTGRCGGRPRLSHVVRPSLATVRSARSWPVSTFKPLYGETLVTGFARSRGLPDRDRLANDGCSSPPPRRGSHFRRAVRPARDPAACSSRTSPGTWFRREYEAGGWPRRAKIVTPSPAPRCPS